MGLHPVSFHKFIMLRLPWSHFSLEFLLFVGFFVFFSPLKLCFCFCFCFLTQPLTPQRKCPSMDAFLRDLTYADFWHFLTHPIHSLIFITCTFITFKEFIMLSILLLLSHFSLVRLCATPWTAAHQASVPSVHGILQARTLEWVAISFSNAWKWKVKVKLLRRIRLLATPWTAAYQAPPSMGFPGNSTGVGCHCLLPSSYL